MLAWWLRCWYLSGKVNDLDPLFFVKVQILLLVKNWNYHVDTWQLNVVLFFLWRYLTIGIFATVQAVVRNSIILSQKVDLYSNNSVKISSVREGQCDNNSCLFCCCVHCTILLHRQMMKPTSQNIYAFLFSPWTFDTFYKFTSIFIHHRLIVTIFLIRVCQSWQSQQQSLVSAHHHATAEAHRAFQRTPNN